MTPHLSKIRSAGIFYLRLMTVEGRSQTYIWLLVCNSKSSLLPRSKNC
jgi:hypothetical protein